MPSIVPSSSSVKASANAASAEMANANLRNLSNRVQTGGVTGGSNGIMQAAPPAQLVPPL